MFYRSSRITLAPSSRRFESLTRFLEHYEDLYLFDLPDHAVKPNKLFFAPLSAFQITEGESKLFEFELARGSDAVADS